jgi:hypothetical protein
LPVRPSSGLLDAVLVYATLLFSHQGKCHSYCLPRDCSRHGVAGHPNSRQLFASETACDSSDDLNFHEEEEEVLVARDMRYNSGNVQRQNRNFQAIRAAGGKCVVRDVYARDPQSQTFWFVGKVASVSDVSFEDCIERQWNLIETHAVNLRPLDLFAARRDLQIWTAPGDSELDVAYNSPDVVFKHHVRGLDRAPLDIKSSLIGFQGEVYERGEEGFRTWRLHDGSSARPEIQRPTENSRSPTEDEMKIIQDAVKGKDIGELYEEQQRRLGIEFD